MITERSGRFIEKFSHPLSRIADSVGRVILALMVILISLDVVLRYFFNRPIKGSYELIEFMMVLVVFLGLAYTQVRKGHVSITLFTGKLSPGQLSVILSITYLLCIIIFSLITWRGILQAEALRVNGTSSDLLFIPNFPFMWIVVIASVLLSLIFVDTPGAKAKGCLPGRRAYFRLMPGERHTPAGRCQHRRCRR